LELVTPQVTHTSSSGSLCCSGAAVLVEALLAAVLLAVAAGVDVNSVPVAVSSVEQALSVVIKITLAMPALILRMFIMFSQKGVKNSTAKSAGLQAVFA
jgi:hypothetical protein